MRIVDFTSCPVTDNSISNNDNDDNDNDNDNNNEK